MKIAAYGLASLVDYSRIRSRQHFPSDVFVGSIIGTLIRRRVGAIAPKDLPDGVPFPAAEFRIMMSAIHILCDEVYYDGPYENVGGKVLAAANSRVVHQRRQTIGRDFHQRAGVFVGKDSCYGPCRGRVLRRKRCATAMKKRPASVALERALTPQGIFQGFNRYETIERGFAGKKSRLAPVLVVADVTQQPHSASSSDQSSDSRV